MLDGNVIVQCFDVFDVVFGDGFGVVEYLVQVVEGDIVVDFFEYVQYV